MSAEKARFIRRVFNDGGAVSAAVGQKKNAEVVDLGELKRPELIRAASLVGAKAPHGKWAAVPNAEIIDMINQRVLNGHEHKLGARDEGRNQVPGEDRNDNNGWDTQPKGGPVPSPKGEPDGDIGDKSPFEAIAEILMNQDGNPVEQGDGQGEGEDQEFTPEEFEPSPENVPADGDSIEEQIEKLKAQAEEQQRHDERQEELREKFEAEKAEQRKLEEQREQRAKELQEQLEQEAKKQEEEGKDAAKQRKQRVKDAKAKLPEKHHKVLPDLLDVLSCGQHAYLVGPPGTGKSFMSEQAAEILGREYGAISCGPQTPESRLWGYMDATGNYRETTFRRLYQSGNSVFTFDEVDNGHTGINTTVNQSLGGDGANFPDEWVDMGTDFSAVATANTWGQGATAEHMGRNPQDEAFLDRFTFLRVEIDPDLELTMVNNAGLVGDKATKWLETIHQLRANADAARVKCVISPRASQKGAELLALGWSRKDVLEARVLKGLTDDRRARLTKGVRI